MSEHRRREEAVFTIEKWLFSLGFDSQTAAPQIEWELKFDARLGAPALADVRGHAPLQILVSSTDGRLYGIGQPVIVTQNEGNQYDVDANGSVALTDALHLVAQLRHLRLRSGPMVADALHVDVNGDGELTLMDVLEVIGELRTRV